MRSNLALALLAGALAAGPAAAQLLTLPPSGDNQKASVSQWIGPVELNVTYSSPDVHAPDGSDRHGKIWGGLVPWGYANLGFGTCGDKCPWRGGANENTVFRASHDVTVEGQPLAAGSYGLHLLPGETEWTVIFSKNSTSWGSFFYDEAEDALRVTVKPEKSAYREWLTYDFTDRATDHATLALEWEDLAVPIRIAVPDVDEVYYDKAARELRSSPGFSWEAWLGASQFLVQKKIHPDAAEKWARHAVSGQFVGQENFRTLSNLADALELAGKGDEAQATRRRAWDSPTASVFELHAEGRQLITRGQKELAVQIFELNARRHPDQWPVHVGLARGYAAVGKTKEALKHARLALAQAPDDGNKKSLAGMIEKLEKGDNSIN